LFELPIDGQVVTSTSVHNQIALCKRVFRVTPSPSKLKRVTCILNGIINKTFTTPLNDANDEVLQRYLLNYDLNVLIIC
jgi:hypothetical protein